MERTKIITSISIVAVVVAAINHFLNTQIGLLH